MNSFTRLAALGVLVAGAMVSPAAAQSAEDEELKAQLAARLPGFVQWVAVSEQRQRSNFVFCTLGDTDVGDHWDRSVPDRINGRRVRVERRSAVPGLETCDVLYLALDEEPNLPAIFSRLQGEPILTVSDIPGFAEAGGVIGLVRSGRRYRFVINPHVAERSGLRITARLLQLADLVGSGAGAAAGGGTP